MYAGPNNNHHPSSNFRKYYILYSFHFIWWESLDNNSSVYKIHNVWATVFASLLKVSYTRRGTVNCFYARGPIFIFIVNIPVFRLGHYDIPAPFIPNPSVIKGFSGFVTQDTSGHRGSEWQLMIFLARDKQKYLQPSLLGLWEKMWCDEKSREEILMSRVNLIIIDPLHPSIQIYNPLHFNDNILKRNIWAHTP